MIALRYAALATSSIGLLASVATAQERPPIRSLGAIVATSSDPIGEARSIRPLSDGRVLVNDPGGRRLLLLDASLNHFTVVADTSPATSRAYGKGLRALMRFTGDSSLVQDEITFAYLVIDPDGAIARVISPPGSSNVARGGAFRSIGGLITPPDGYDQAGRLLFAAPLPFFLSLLPDGFVGDTLMVAPDSTAILRQRLGTTSVDTIVSLKAARVRQAVTKRERGGQGRPAFNPIPSGDDWTLLDDGTIAIVRVGDYHVDWVTPDRRLTSGPKIPTQWVRLTDSMRVAIMDSVRSERLSAAPRADGPVASSVPAQAFVEPSDLPDYRPPFMNGFTRADAEGRVWVRERQSSPTSAVVYDVIDRQGRLTDRVQLPPGSTLAGFGPGVVYVTSIVQGRVHLTRMAFR